MNRERAAVMYYRLTVMFEVLKAEIDRERKRLDSLQAERIPATLSHLIGAETSIGGAIYHIGSIMNALELEKKERTGRC